MIMTQNEKIALDVRKGSFCIYEKETMNCLSSGDIDNATFRGCEEKMVDFAWDEFNKLAESK